MRLSILTAALQELTPRDRRDSDPDVAIEEWLEFARQIGCPNIELSAALHPTESDVPAAALLDPVANTLDLRQPFNAERATRVRSAMQSTSVGLSDLAYFDNMLAADESVRSKKHDLMLRVFDAAVLLGTDAVTGFVGRNPRLGMDANLVMFEEVFVPLLKEAKARGLTFRVEQCPMPGWNITDAWHNNIAYAPGPWIALHRICERHGVGDHFRIHYDPSHAVLMGQDSRSVFQYLKDTGYNFLITGFHVKGQVIDSRGISAWGYGGQTMQRGDWTGWTISSPHGSCSASSRRRPSWSWNMNIPRLAYKTRHGWRRFWLGHSPLRERLTRPPRRCTPSSMKCSLPRGYPCRGSAARPIDPELIEWYRHALRDGEIPR